MSDKIILTSSDELKAVVRSAMREALESFMEKNPEPKEQEFVWGLAGICKLFGVTRATALIYKKSFLAPACEQEGHRIRVNVALARELFAKRKTLKDVLK
jgi:hypothetical protein